MARSPRPPASTFDAFYNPSRRPLLTPSSPHSNRLLSSSPRIAIRLLSPGGLSPDRGARGGALSFLRVPARLRRAALAVTVALVLGGLVLVVVDSRSLGDGKAASRFMQVGGFGKDWMGRQEEEQVRLPTDEAGELRFGGKAEGQEKECLLFPWREGCDTAAKDPRDPFEGLEFQDEGGHIYYPAVPAPRKPRRPGERPRKPDAMPVDPAQQPHPIHYLIQQAKEDWNAKLRRQSTTLDEAVAEYEWRYKRRPPKGFDEWFAFAKKNEFVMIDEFDLAMRQVEPFLALQPSLLRERHEKLQFDADFWMQVRPPAEPRVPGLSLTEASACRTRRIRLS